MDIKKVVSLYIEHVAQYRFYDIPGFKK